MKESRGHSRGWQISDDTAVTFHFFNQLVAVYPQKSTTNAQKQGSDTPPPRWWKKLTDFKCRPRQRCSLLWVKPNGLFNYRFSHKCCQCTVLITCWWANGRLIWTNDAWSISLVSRCVITDRYFDINGKYRILREIDDGASMSDVCFAG